MYTMSKISEHTIPVAIVDCTHIMGSATNFFGIGNIAKRNFLDRASDVATFEHSNSLPGAGTAQTNS